MKNLTASPTYEEERRDSVRVWFKLLLGSHPVDRLKGAEQVKILLEVASQQEIFSHRLLPLLTHLIP